MPLVISLREGQDFYVEDARFVVSRIEGDEQFVLTGPGGDARITAEESTEVAKDVLVSAGDGAQVGTVKVVVDAPRDKLILRGDRYRGGARHVEPV